ncbi:M55 family metallopeptidase [Martelella alba]|uniref:Aminopeptidase n=1 Tax=Martelella alba TaxID=2590451 RepID=A0ABY2SHS0_9HYPH|nr:M55 family metallopeptidase [Martelella alba]TKI04893.1 aminopeptidase [Martelella alba]
MQIFISADIEGVAGVMRPEQCSSSHAEYHIARGLMEREVNAAIEGAFLGGASGVTVADSHGQMTNLRAENLDCRARLVQGKPRMLSMVEGVEHQRYDGMLFIGYHSAAGEFGVLSHTINGRAFWRVMINGEVMGETDIYAAAGAEQGVPLLMVSGDDQLQRWVAQRYPQTAFATVKRAIAHTTAESLSPQAAQDLIRETVRQALKTACPPATRHIAPPYRLVLQASRPVLADLFALVPGVAREDGMTVSYQAAAMHDIIRLLSVFSYLATTQS